MAKILGNFHLALLIGIILLAAAMFGLHRDAMDGLYWTQFLRYLHVFAGILWIGLLYYFNFVQIPTMPGVPAELKPGITKHIAPAALFWFRWSRWRPWCSACSSPKCRWAATSCARCSCSRDSGRSASACGSA